MKLKILSIIFPLFMSAAVASEKDNEGKEDISEDKVHRVYSDHYEEKIKALKCTDLVSIPSFDLKDFNLALQDGYDEKEIKKTFMKCSPRLRESDAEEILPNYIKSLTTTKYDEVITNFSELFVEAVGKLEEICTKGSVLLFLGRTPYWLYEAARLIQHIAEMLLRCLLREAWKSNFW